MLLALFHQLKYSHKEDVLVTSLRFVLAKLFVQVKLSVDVPAIQNVDFSCCPHIFLNDVRVLFSCRPLQPSLKHQFVINKRTNRRNCALCNHVFLLLTLEPWYDVSLCAS
jgi:hypothetical protein